MTLSSCGSLILNSLDNTNNISLTNNNSPSNGLKINGGNVNVTSLTINSANNDYLISDDHTGTISSIIFDVDSDFSSKNLVNLGSTSSTSTTLNGEIIIKCTDTNVVLTKDLDTDSVNSVALASEPIPDACMWSFNAELTVVSTARATSTLALSVATCFDRLN